MLLAVIVVSIAAVAFTGAMFGVVNKTTVAESDRELNDQCDAIAQAALHQALSEIISGTDSTGHGLGAMGILYPEIFLDSQGNAVGEYRTLVETVGTVQMLVAVAGTPDLSSPRFTATTRAVLAAEKDVLLRPLPAAFGVSGPAPTPDWDGVGGTNISISGGADNAAFAASDADTLTAFVDSIGNLIHNRKMESDSLSGGQTTTYTDDDGTEFEVPIVLDTEDFVSAAVLNEYRETLRSGVEELSDYATRRVDSAIGKTPVVWGTDDAPEVTFFDADAAGKNALNNATISGSGILVIQHTVKPTDLQLDWNGDVYVLGYSGDGSDMFYPSGKSDITINGNFVLLADEDTEASYESGGSTSLTVNGSMVVLAEASSHEAEIETEGSSELNVNGIVALYGSRVEIEASSNRSVYNINGSLTAGIPDDTTRSDEFTFDMNGNVDISYDENSVASAIDSLANMEFNLGLGDHQNLASYAYDLRGGGSGGETGHDALADMEALISQNGVNYDYGVDLDALQGAAEPASGSTPSAPFWLAD